VLFTHVGKIKPFAHRDIYLTPPGPTGCGLVRIANGAGSTWTAC
jgi:hypothetical protein